VPWNHQCPSSNIVTSSFNNPPSKSHTWAFFIKNHEPSAINDDDEFSMCHGLHFLFFFREEEKENFNFFREEKKETKLKKKKMMRRRRERKDKKKKKNIEERKRE